jgi:hypothetical protein
MPSTSALLATPQPGRWWESAVLPRARRSTLCPNPPTTSEAARALASFLLDQLVRDGVVLRTWKDGAAKTTAFLEDVATLVEALLTLYEVTGEPLVRERSLARRGHGGALLRALPGFYDTSVDGDPLLIRPRNLDDNAVPGGGRPRPWRCCGSRCSAARRAGARWRSAPWRRSPPPSGAPRWDSATSPGRSTSPSPPLARWPSPVTRGRPTPARWSAPCSAAGTPWRVLAWRGRRRPAARRPPPVGGRATAYVCRGFVCDAPTTDVEELRVALEVRAGG